MGFAVSAHTRRYFARPDVAYVPLEDAAPVDWGLVWSADGATARLRAFSEAALNRSISAGPLEDFVKDVAVKVLTKLDTSGYEPATTTRPEADIIADEKDREKLRELKEMWLNDDDFTTADFQAMRTPIVKRMKERQRKTVRQPIVVLEGIAGPEAEANWERLEKAEDFTRMNAIYRFLFAAVIVHPPTRKGRGFDTDRVEIEPNPLVH